MESQNELNAPPAGAEEAPPRLTLGRFIVMAVIAVAVYVAFAYLQPINVLKVLIGLSFVIFIHELGHFLVAKACDVHVTHFSIGFGPVVPGCWFQWGETTYQLCLLPLGGYVQMVGQVDGDEGADGSENDPRSYRNKSVGQRMAIISAGVIMNAILALFCFIAIYRGPGKDRFAGVIAAVDGGSPAFADGLRTGMELKRVGDKANPYFDDLRVTVINSRAGEKVQVVAQRPGDPAPLDITIEPRKGKKDANPVIGITHPTSLNLATKRLMGPTAQVPAELHTPAYLAEPKFEFGDVIVATTDPDEPSKVTPLADDPLKKDQKNYFDFARRMQLLADREVVVRVKRGEEGHEREVDISVKPAYRTSIGATMEMGQIIAVRKNSPADGAKIQLPKSGEKFVRGDIIEKVEVVDADGKPLVFEKKTLDPEKLPQQLRAWARRLAKAGKLNPAPEVSLYLRRHRQVPGIENETVKETLRWDNDWAFDQVLPLAFASPLAIPELGLAYLIKTTVVHVDDPERSKLKPGDVIKNLKATYIDETGKETTSGWQLKKRDLNADEWARFGKAQFETGAKIDRVLLKIERDQKTEEIEIVPTFDETWPIANRGWYLIPDLRKQKADTTLEAISLGLYDTHNSMWNVLRGIWQMITGRIDWGEHLGGPISIARYAYGIAGHDIWEFVFFLGLISINLAVINFLPIPILDGGHMVFLIYEGLRGKPASEGVRVAATYGGLAFIVCLILLVSWLDIGRLL